MTTQSSKDVINVHHAGRLSCAPDGIKSFEKWNLKKFTLFQLGILCVMGTDTNKCKIQWFTWSHGNDFTSCYTNNDKSNSLSNTYGWNPFVSLTMGNEYDSKTVYPSLTINAGETKILLVHVFCCQFAGLRDSWPKSILGLYIALPIVYKYNDSTQTYLRSVVIYTPKPGTFDPNKPPQ